MLIYYSCHYWFASIIIVDFVTRSHTTTRWKTFLNMNFMFRTNVSLNIDKFEETNDKLYSEVFFANSQLFGSI